MSIEMIPSIVEMDDITDGQGVYCENNGAQKEAFGDIAMTFYTTYSASCIRTTTYDEPSST